jgi:small subunit ribosomal protein S9
MEYYEAVGRRKAATARVRLFPGGDGSIVVNDRPVGEYFALDAVADGLRDPLRVTQTESRFNISVKVGGGGYRGQGDAIRLGIGRALIKVDPELRPALRKGGYLTRDARVKERKKPGLKGARKAPQYTKR